MIQVQPCTPRGHPEDHPAWQSAALAARSLCLLLSPQPDHTHQTRTAIDRTRSARAFSYKGGMKEQRKHPKSTASSLYITLRTEVVLPGFQTYLPAASSFIYFFNYFDTADGADFQLLVKDKKA